MSNPGGRQGVRYGIQILLLMLILVAFVGTALGAFDVRIGLEGGLAFRKSAFSPGALPLLLTRPEFLVLISVGVILALLLPALSPIRASLLTLACILPVWYVGYTVSTPSPQLPLEYSLLTILMLYVVNVLAGYFTETSSKQQLISVFGQYIPPEVVNALSAGSERVDLEGEAREMSILFCDVKNFTAIAEHLEPKQLVSVLNALFTPLTRVIHKHMGTIDKYMGDAVMAFWGAPLKDPGHAYHALLAALEIQEEMKTLRKQFERRGWPRMEVGIGISTGVVNVGNMGSQFRVAYTVVGDSVNLAARLEAATRDLHRGIIVSEATRDASPEVAFRELGTIRVKGKRGVLRVYEPLCLKRDLTPVLKAKLDKHAHAMALYYKRHWDEALTAFGQLWEEDPEDELYSVYLRTISGFTKGPRPAEWAGELELGTGKWL